MRTAILTTLFATFTLTIAASPVAPPGEYKDIYPGGSILLVSNVTGQRAVEFRQPIDINQVTVIDPPSSAITTVTHLKFNYFLNVEETKVECHAYLDEAGLEPFRVPFTKVRPLELRWKNAVMKVKSVLCIMVV